MNGIERVYCNLSIQAVLKAWMYLMQTPVVEVLNKQEIGKTDTLGMDAVPENTIRDMISEYFGDAILVTEETDEITRANWPEDPNPKKQPLMFFSDPMDRSSQFKKFLSNFPGVCGKSEFDLVGEIIAHPDTKSYWEKNIDPISPLIISGATIAVSCVSKGKIVISVVMNIISRTIFIACESGIYQMLISVEPNKLDSSLSLIDLKTIEQNGDKIVFSSEESIYKDQDDLLRFASFVGKTGYEENLRDSGILSDYKKHLYHSSPGGPARILFLSNFQPDEEPVGFILANGEKIGEWIHWLAYVKFAKDIQGANILRIYEINLKRPWTKESILMSPPPPYSVFRHKSSALGSFLNLSRLRDLDRPSHYRSMVLVTRKGNMRIKNIMRGKNFYEVSSSF